MDMTPMEINVAMLRNKVSKADIARACGVSGPAVSLVVGGKSVSHPIQKALAEAIGTTPDQIWPSRYDETGQPLRTKQPKAA